jgi:phosphatidate cytidylyltransferase
MSSIKPRLLTAAIGLPIVILILALSEQFHWIITCVLSILCAIMSFEILSAKKLQKNLKILLPCMLFALAEPLFSCTSYSLIPVYLFVLTMFLIMILNNNKIDYSDISFFTMDILVIVFGISCILMLNNYYNGFISFVFALCVGIPWVSDAGAYFAGVTLGKRKLCPKISPNKTVEGFIGGLIFGAVSAPLIGFIFSLIYQDFAVNYLLLIVLGLLGSLISVLGDLSFSIIKRSCGIKDYGSIFPGHGGMLDRFDSVIFTAPLMYLFCSNLQVVLV